MIRRHESPHALQAGALALLVHVLFFLLLFVGVNWKTVPPPQATMVELWDALPPTPEPVPQPPQPAPPEPEPAPEPPKPEPRPEPPPEPKADIVVKPKKPEPPKPKEEKPKQAKPQEIKPKPDPRLKEQEEARKREEYLKRLLAEEEARALKEQQQRVAQQLATARAAQSGAAAQSALAAWQAQVSSKIRSFVNPQVCGSGKPELVFRISLMRTGELLSPPQLIKGSGIAACDQAVERAILQAEPLPLPSEPELFERIRDLRLNFKPNE